MAEQKICVWTQDDFEGDLWVSQCGTDFILNEDSPKKNGMKFCCGCGRELDEDFYKEEESNG